MKLVGIILIGVLLVSCKKKEDRSCWKVAGDKITKTIELNDFDQVFFGAHLDYTIVQDSVNYIVLEGAENLLNLVSTDISDNKLSIENKNKCNFLRSYKKKGIHVTLHFKDMANMEYQGTEKLVSEGVLNLNYFTFLINEGAGPVELTLNTNFIDGTINDGYGDFTLHGTSNYASFKVSSNGYCNTKDFLVANSIDISSNSAVKSWFNIDGATTRIEIKNIGDIEYIGTPLSLETLIYNDGQVINGN